MLRAPKVYSFGILGLLKFEQVLTITHTTSGKLVPIHDWVVVNYFTIRKLNRVISDPNLSVALVLIHSNHIETGPTLYGDADNMSYV